MKDLIHGNISGGTTMTNPGLATTLAHLSKHYLCWLGAFDLLLLVPSHWC